MTTNENNIQIFNSIAKTYDKLNHFLSLNIDKQWRSKALSKYINNSTVKVLDIACGTGDFAIKCAQLGAREVIGIDLSPSMLEIAEKKIKNKNLDSIIHVQEGDCANLNFDDNTFDIVTIAFGVRNFEDLDKSLKEIHRVLKDNGKIIILEFTLPRNEFIRTLYNFYINKILPLIGKLISGDKNAYIYLPTSIGEFLQYEDFTNHLERFGFRDVSYKSMTMGIVCGYYGTSDE
ncbi:bifunctional demethylmenaquinone methyltransferase/2-methoxy-6-polyprenyl-1,4-benzoquinol methylase UbiE [Bacteroidales bacterium OttesenSCG-928-K03]|nr:bifunctional demethylmenaquinone methyltransferase/2-methoxy-6-polyprenyl-1,4-benzoquinol methylase UbiE [Odoribacter sp. OttesenSCG-928-L07]MDL2242631.1 bifunctional demethylmenaquinone methyltransferase/2-methoxy-6-polyprenyl-1,4-benzoquinol methylase UbiE [Bacteroidales bacterium OttesenSCG-928-K03]